MRVPDAEAFCQTLQEIIRLHPEGLTEYALLQRLRQDGHPIGEGRLDEAHELFRTHFLLFHHLYLLRDLLHENGAGELEIHVLGIRWRPAQPRGAQALARPDPLAGYYLDLDNLTGTTRAEVDRLLSQFWIRFGRYDRRGEALATLDLPPEADDATIRGQYRRLAMRYHPDRGGDGAKLQAINAAMAILAPRNPTLD